MMECAHYECVSYTLLYNVADRQRNKRFYKTINNYGKLQRIGLGEHT